MHYGKVVSACNISETKTEPVSIKLVLGSTLEVIR